MPLIELVVLLEVGRYIGTARTVALVVVTAVAGSFFTSREGTRVLGRIRSQIAQGMLPSQALFDGALVLAGGLLLLTPGLITDIMGFICLIPASRALLQRGISRKVEQWMMGSY